MDYVAIGSMIKMLRKSKGITQEKLAEGIMSRESLVKLESGKPVNKIILDKLITKLGYVTQRFFSVPVTEDEFRALELDRQYKIASRKYKTDEMEKIINEMKSLPKFETKMYRQRLLKYKADVHAQSISPDWHAVKQLYDEAIKISIPRYNPFLVKTYFLSSDDHEIIGSMASAMYELGHKNEAIDLLQDLSANVREKIIDGHEKARTLAFTLYLLSQCLGRDGRHAEALAACNEAIDESETNQAFGLLPDINFNKACALYYTGKHEEAYDYLNRAYYSALVHGNKKITDDIKYKAKEMFDITVGVNA